METFYEYLTRQVETGVTDDPAGDFAIDAAADESFPKEAKADPEGFCEIFRYLYYTLNVWDRIIDVFLECWQEYYKTATGKNGLNYNDDGGIKMIEEVKNTPPVKPINPTLLRDLITIFSWLDYEHQLRACGALNVILEDQIAETKNGK